jgi:serine/threonine protein kinase
VDGPTLSELIKEGPLPPDAAAVVGLQLASALEHAHFHRVVHRDLKPANVMINSWGEAKLMDFGIAQQEDLDRLTKTGMAVGTPSYMSPEQVSGSPVDARSDIYSLGVMLYEALAGKRPFTGTNPGEVFTRIATGKFEPLRKVAPKVPWLMAELVERAMAKDPRRRFKDATTLRRALEDLLARLDGSPSAVLVGFLRSREKISEADALARLSHTELAKFTQQGTVVKRAPKKQSRWTWVLVAGVLAAAAAQWRAQWQPAVEQWWKSVAPGVGR